MSQQDERMKNYGDDLPRKSSKAIRIVFQNINGIPRNKNTVHASEIGIKNREKSVDIFMFAEHNVNVHHKDIYQQIKQQIKYNIKKTHLAMVSSPTEGANATGGVGILTTNKWVNRITETDEMDKLCHDHGEKQQKSNNGGSIQPLPKRWKHIGMDHPTTVPEKKRTKETTPQKNICQ